MLIKSFNGDSYQFSLLNEWMNMVTLALMKFISYFNYLAATNEFAFSFKLVRYTKKLGGYLKF